MRICVILEGCYPYVTGGVSTWVHQYMKAMPEHEFVLWTVAASSEDAGKFKYQLPDNVVEVHEVFLQDALKLASVKKKYKFMERELKALTDFVHCQRPDWNVLFEMYNDRKISPMSFLTSSEFLDILTAICQRDYPYTAFSDMFHTMRSMFLPVLYVLGQEVPKADLYHTIATGYSGLLARLGSYKYKVPFMLTEHGIYTREREEEIIGAKWVGKAFKQQWIQFFYMLSVLIYSRAHRVTSLYRGAMQMQIDMGAAAEKCSVIANGISYERFCDIPRKAEDGMVDIGAVVRFAPIKDIKTMIYAFYELSTRMENVRLHILGGVDDQEYADECLALIEQLHLQDKVLVPGLVNVVEYFQKLDFTILTSLSEGQPLSVLESFAAGLPVVTTDVGSCSELILGIPPDTFGRAGYFVPPMQREKLADAMEILASSREVRLSMGKIGQMRASAYFRYNTMLTKYRDLYKEVEEIGRNRL